MCVGLEVAALASDYVAGPIANPSFSELEDNIVDMHAVACP